MAFRTGDDRAHWPEPLVEIAADTASDGLHRVAFHSADRRWPVEAAAQVATPSAGS